MNCPQCDLHTMYCGCQEQPQEKRKNISSGEDAFFDEEELSLAE